MSKQIKQLNSRLAVIDRGSKSTASVNGIAKLRPSATPAPTTTSQTTQTRTANPNPSTPTRAGGQS